VVRVDARRGAQEHRGVAVGLAAGDPRRRSDAEDVRPPSVDVVR
jgi:hypothetical protein